jgi:hypothetical protein
LHQNTIHVTPAGEFQPSGLSRKAIGSEFNLWKTILRGYAEEFLPGKEAKRSGGRDPLYAEHPYNLLNEARSESHLFVWYLGLGLDPLTWKPEILVACVIDAPTFDRIFGNMPDENRKGELLIGDGFGLPFSQGEVDGYLHSGRMLAAGAACLQLAWQHRATLLGVAGP